MKNLLTIPATLLILTQTAMAAPDPEAGKALWYRDFDSRSCTSCHGQSPRDEGNHQKTGKTIAPMAPSVNPQRYTDATKVEKWLLRNCRWTLARECTRQEKDDVLTWLKQQ
ncbi:MAG: hypothetical protein CMI00_03750 [Oceanospirillaceae bacterium]|nr:hypothetical protein [Oceanospirillaceae bacterium]|tara:strand:+ start:110 stop:442 length:333 start_codon:yes stop_codon:yes gene_type:complete